MFSWFTSRRNGSTVVVPSEHDFWMQLERMQTPRSVFNGQGDAHGDIDFRLTQKVESLLVPQLGPWEQSGAWFHQMDYYGDGVRSLTFRRDVFPRSLVTQLQALLVGEHEPFCILCIATDRLTGSPAPHARDDDYLGIFTKQLLVTRPLANELSVNSRPPARP